MGRNGRTREKKKMNKRKEGKKQKRKKKSNEGKEKRIHYCFVRKEVVRGAEATFSSHPTSIRRKEFYGSFFIQVEIHWRYKKKPTDREPNALKAFPIFFSFPFLPYRFVDMS